MTLPLLECGAQPGVVAQVDVESSVRGTPDHRVGVVVAAGFALGDQRRHELPDDRSVLELVSAGPDRDVVPAQRRAVVNRYPVVGDVIDAGMPTSVNSAVTRSRAKPGESTTRPPVVM